MIRIHDRCVYNTPFSDEAESSMTDRGVTTADRILALVNLACIALIAAPIAALDPTTFGGRGDFAPRQMSACVMDKDGYLRGELYGALRKSLAWQGATMLCDGMPRPEGNGIRLVFAEQTDPELPGLVIVIGLAEAIPGAPTEELMANVTVVDQRNQQFYSTQEEPRCWVRFDDQLRLRGTTTETWRLDGTLYCASALAALTGTGSLTLGDVEFSGILKPAVTP